MASAPTSSGELIDLLRKSGVAAPDKLAGVSDLALPGDPQKAAAELVAQGVVTRFQAQQLLAGRHRGFRIGPYMIQDLLGRGGMGAVYLAEHLDLHRKVAIKVLVPGKDEDHRLALERFQREARSAAALDHPNIVRIFDVSRQNDTPYLVMEYVEGETLQQVLDRDGAIPYPTAAEYIAQAAAGLQHAHEKGFIHRDIKPGNLIRDKSGTIKILDMGLARSSSTQDKLTEQLDNGAVVGTADFIAPEQGLNQPGVDGRADIYSLGATFFYLIIGKPPFEGNTTQKLLQHQLRSAPTLASLDATLPKGLSAVVAKMLAKKPADRYQQPAEVIAALAPWTANNARIIAGLSRTRLAQGADLQATLSDLSRNTDRRLNPPQPDSGEIDPSSPDQETGEISGAATTREPRRKKPTATEKLPRQKMLLYGGIGVGVLVVGAVVGWAAFGGGKKPAQPPVADNRPRSEQEQQPRPKVEPMKNPPSAIPPRKNPPTSTAGEKTLFRMDLGEQRAFVIRSGLVVDPKNPGSRNVRVVSRTGGEPPAGWTARTYNQASEMEYFSQEVGGRPVLGIRAASGPGAAMLFSPRFNCPTGACRVRFEYDAGVRDGKFAVRFKPADNRPAWDVVRPPVTGGAWRAEEVEFDLRGAVGGYFEFHNTDDRPSASVRIRDIVITEMPGTRSEKVFYQLDAADLPLFQNTKEGRRKTAGMDDPRVRGMYFGGWKPETVSEWECTTVAGAKAIGFTNISEVRSAQIGIELEQTNGIGLSFEPGQRVRLRVVYRTTGKCRGSIYFQNYGDRKVPARSELPSSNDAWTTVDVITTRGDSGLRALIDTNETGAGNTLYVRSITVFDAGRGDPPVAMNDPTPRLSGPNDPANWAEGATLHELDIAKIPEFRVIREKTGRVSGEPERLPPGVMCQSWKDGAVGEFRREKVDGVPALGVVNLNDEKSGQFVFNLEGGMKLPLVPGKAYRVKVGYLTKNDATGSAPVQVVPGYKRIAGATLPNTGGKWATAVCSFIRPPASEMVEVRMTVENSSVGEGNTVWIRSLEIVELIPPKK